MSNLTRRDRENRAFGLVLASGGGALASAVLAILWIAGVAGFGLFFLVAVVTAISFYLLRRSLGR